MAPRFNLPVSALVCVLLATLVFPASARADFFPSPRYADTAYDLINGVNALRAANGLPPYSISPTLMYTAQTQADFMAANGVVTHSGPGGSSVTSRLLAAGYPLAGDLSQGGFRSENITGGVDKSAQDAVSEWMGDAPHLNTMLSPNLTEIGAGVAVANGMVYYVIDCARPTGAGSPQVAVTPVGGGSAVPVVEAPIQAVVVSTPNADGNVIHEVKYGQTLWQIAISYETKIDEIKRLNNLTGNDIYPGEKLLVKMGVPQQRASTAPATFTAEATIPSTPTVALLPTLTPPPLTATFTPTPAPALPANNPVIMGVVIGIVVLALLGGGMIAWTGASRKDRRGQFRENHHEK